MLNTNLLESGIKEGKTAFSRSIQGKPRIIMQ